jgi:hypothetical protein
VLCCVAVVLCYAATKNTVPCDDAAAQPASALEGFAEVALTLSVLTSSNAALLEGLGAADVVEALATLQCNAFNVVDDDGGAVAIGVCGCPCMCARTCGSASLRVAWQACTCSRRY